MMNDEMKRVEGRDSLYRTSKGAIVNTDKDAYEAYKKKRRNSKLKEESFKSLETQLQEAKSEIEELKSLIKQIIHK